VSRGQPCKWGECSNTAKGETGFCFLHVATAHPCVIDGCPNRVAAHSRSRCCPDHRPEGIRRLRKGVLPWEK
jgi:hypothetical protein